MMRGVGIWAVAVREPEGEIEVRSFPLKSVLTRHRLLRLPVIRGVIALWESLSIGFKALQISANIQLGEDEHGEEEEISKGAWIGAMVALTRAGDRPVLRHPGRSDEPRQGPDRLPAALLARRGSAQNGDLPRVPRSVGKAARPQEGLRVPRRRAQDHRLLRGGTRADTGERRALLAPASAMRNELPADRDGDRDLHVRADRPARLVLARPLADPRGPADRRHLLRGDPLVRSQPQQADGCAG